MLIKIYGINALKLHWKPATCLEGISHYRIYKDNVLIKNTIGNDVNAIVTGITTNIEYSFYVVGVTNQDRITKKSNVVKVMLKQDNGLNYYLTTDI